MSPPVLIVGAGIAGLALSRALAQRGIGSTIVDERAEKPGLGMGLNLPGNAVRALAALDVPLEALASGLPVVRREYRNHKDRLLFETDDAEFWRGVAAPVCMRHGYLLEALRSPSAGVAHNDVQYGRTVVSARPAVDGVDVQFAGEEEPRTYAFVVGADGIRSVTRSSIAGPGDAGVRASLMTETSWRLIASNPGVQCWTAWSGADATFLLIPVERDVIYGYASSTRGQAAGTDREWLARAFFGFPEQVTRVVAEVLSGSGELYHSPVREVRMPRWHSGRLVLIGDAAHATGPVWGQGVALALEDALVLAELLHRSGDWSKVGQTFEGVRRPRVDHVQAATDKMSRLARMPLWLRDRAAPRLGPRAFRDAYEPLRADPMPAETMIGDRRRPLP